MDFLVIDFYKWLYMFFEVVCVLVKNSIGYKKIFLFILEYLVKNIRGIVVGDFWFSEYGL